MSNELKDKAIKIQGKDYILVKDRVLAFNELYPNGSIVTELVSDPADERVIVKATVTPDVDKPARAFVDYSQAVIGEGYINKTSALENASTSAVGRALAYMGIGVLDSIASADEFNKATTSPEPVAKSEDFKELYSLVLRAKNPSELNEIMDNPKYKTLHLEEKRQLQQRIARAVLNLKGKND